MKQLIKKATRKLGYDIIKYQHTVKVDKIPRCLGILLCYNDGDILEEQINYLLSQNHDIIVWDHGSDDNTSEILNKFNDIFIQRKFIPREFDFYNLYPAMSRNLINNFTEKYDIISWPDQDEFLEGPKRDKSYYEYIIDFYNSEYTFLQFDNFVYWFTEKDDESKKNIKDRIHHYSINTTCAPRIRAWKAKYTNLRIFNHNNIDGEKYPVNFKLRHYPFRSKQHLLRRLYKDRANLERNGSNVHYNAMLRNLETINSINSDWFHYDDCNTELNSVEKFNWREKIYQI